MREGGVPAQAIRRAAARRGKLALRLQRELHRIPELAFQEFRTTRYVGNFLERRGIPFEPFQESTGGVAVFGEGERCVMLRADLDGLPVQEETVGKHASRYEGRMHACGHDAHTAILLATADALASGEVPFRGKVVCLFQPAEEGPGGCRKLIEGGLLERHPARAATALHVWPQLASGRVALASGPVMASMDTFRLVFQGRGGHGAYPHRCIDPVVMAAEGVLALQTLVSRRADPLQPALVTVGQIHGGTASNIIPDRVEIDGTVRAFSEEVREVLLGGIADVAAGIARTYGGGVDCHIARGYPITRNDPVLTGRLWDALTELRGPEQMIPGDPTMGAEDMSYLLERVPGCYVKLGASSDPASAAPLHSPRFQVDPACLPVGIEVMLCAVAAFSMEARPA